MESGGTVAEIMTLPVEIHFNRHQWCQFRWFLTGMFLVTGFIFDLVREEMLEARAALAQILAAAGRPNLIPDFP